MILTGFHAIEERLRRLSREEVKKGWQLFYASPGPRAKKILAQAAAAGIVCTQSSEAQLDSLVSQLEEAERKHRGLILSVPKEDGKKKLTIELFLHKIGNKSALAIMLDSITDPHNMGAILRSCDQFGTALAVIPERRGAASDGASVSRSSAGANAWVPVAEVPNLVRAVQQLKEGGFWVYGADARGESLRTVDFAPRSLIIMGSEGSGISRLLARECDQMVSIPTFGRIDSLNVSVAAGIFLYEASGRSTAH